MKLSLFSIDHPRLAAVIHIFVIVAAMAALLTAGLNAAGLSAAVIASHSQTKQSESN